MAMRKGKGKSDKGKDEGIASFAERRQMMGIQGYSEIEAFRQICNASGEWDQACLFTIKTAFISVLGGPWLQKAKLSQGFGRLWAPKAKLL